MLNGGPISWSSHKQSTVEYSTIEAEYMALWDASWKVLTRKQFGQELKVPSSSSLITNLSDNQSALEIAENPANYHQAKHIDIQYYAICHYLWKQSNYSGLHTIQHTSHRYSHQSAQTFQTLSTYWIIRTMEFIWTMRNFFSEYAA